MAAMTHVYRRSTGVYEYRRLIPPRLRPILGGKTWRIESLETKDAAEAKRKAATVELRVIGEFEAAEIALLDTTAATWFETEFPRIKREYTRDMERDHFNADNFDPRREVCYGLMIDPLVDEADLEERVAGFVKQRGLPFDRGTKEFDRLIEAAQQHYAEYYAMPSPPQRPAPTPALHVTMNVQPLTMGALVDGWAREAQPTEKTVYSWKRIMAKLTRHLGHDDVTQIIDADIVSWKEALLAGGLSVKTAANHLTIAKTLFNWGQQNKKISTNPARGITLKVRKKSAVRGFTDEEASRILTAARAEKEAHRRWVPWLACFTGARLEELCGAAAADVRTIRGIPCLHVRLENRDARAGLKRHDLSERIIPLHSALIAEGFLDYVATLAEKGPLFPNITPDRFGRRGGNGSKTLGRWVRDKVGITDPNKAPNHSWRHRFKTLCRATGMRQDLEDYLTSHSEGTSGSRYGEYEVEALGAAIEKIRSPV
jgi:integrase